MAVDPMKEAREAATLKIAQDTYRRLGAYLSGRFISDTGEVIEAYRKKHIRQAAVDARRFLERRWGEPVRFTSYGTYATEAAGGGKGRRKFSGPGRAPGEGGAARVLPTWSMRKHMTVTKPPPGIPFPQILYIPLDPETYEPLGVYDDRAANGMEQAVRAAAAHAANRMQLKDPVTRKRVSVERAEELLAGQISAAYEDAAARMTDAARALSEEAVRVTERQRKAASASPAAEPAAVEDDSDDFGF